MQFIVIGFTTFSHFTPLHCAICPLVTLFSFFFKPPPPPNVTFLYILVHLKGLVK